MKVPQGRLFDCDPQVTREQPFARSRLLGGSAARVKRDAQRTEQAAVSTQPTLSDDLFEAEVSACEAALAPSGKTAELSPRVLAIQRYNRTLGSAYCLADALGREVPGFKKKLPRQSELLEVLLGTRKEVTFPCTSESDWRELIIAVERTRHLTTVDINVVLESPGIITLELDREPAALPASDLADAVRAFSGKKVPYARWEGEVKQLAVLTCDRPQELERCLNGYLENFRRYHREGLPITVWDDSGPIAAKQNQALVKAFQARGIPVTYVGVKEKEKLRARMEKGLVRKLNKPASEVKTALDELLGVRRADGGWQGSAGKQRQWIATFTAGTRSLVVDDDTLPCVADNDPEELSRAAGFGARHLARMSAGLGTGHQISGEDLVSPYLRTRVPVPIHYDMVGAAEAENPHHLAAAGFTFHKDTGGMQVVEAFLSQGAEAAGALQGDLQPVTVENRTDKTRFSGSAYVTPLDIDFLGLNLSSGRNEDFALGEFFTALTGQENKGSHRFLHFHQRGLRHTNQARAYFEESLNTCVIIRVKTLLQEVLTITPASANDPMALSAAALQRASRKGDVFAPGYVLRDIVRIRKSLREIDLRLMGLADLEREAVVPPTPLVATSPLAFYPPPQRNLDGSAVESCDIFQKEADPDDLEGDLVPTSLVSTVYPSPSSDNEAVWSAFERLNESLSVLETGDAASWRMPPLFKAIAAAEARLNWDAQLLPSADLQRMQREELPSLCQYLRGLRANLRASILDRGLCTDADVERLERGTFLTERQLWQMATASHFCSTMGDVLEVFGKHYLKRTRRVDEFRNDPRMFNLAAQGAQKVLRKRQALAGQDPLDPVRLKPHLARMKEELTRLKADLEAQFLFSVPDTDEQEAQLHALMEERAQAAVRQTLEALPYAHAMQERLHLTIDAI